MRISGEEHQEEAPALVLERWNGWVKVYLPQLEETRWVNLDEVAHRPLAVNAHADAEDSQAADS